MPPTLRSQTGLPRRGHGKCGFYGTIDGEEFEDGSAEDFDLELGAGYFLDDFEAQLVGANAGETKELTVVFPEEYDETLAGKEAKFTVKVNSISEKSIPEYNDAFVSSISDYSTTAEYEDSLKAELLASQQEKQSVYCRYGRTPDGYGQCHH